MIEQEYFMGCFIAQGQTAPPKWGIGVIKSLQLNPHFKPLLSALTLTTISHGVDVSKWQDYMYWPTTRSAGAKFAYMKMTQGNTIKDSDAIENMTNSRGIIPLRGGYHFLSSTPAGDVQADYMLDFMRDEVKDYGELPVCLDVEISVSVSVVKAFCYRVLERMGYMPVIYTSIGAWGRVTGTDKAWAVNCPLWVAHWYVDNPLIPAPWTDWVTHQWTNKGVGKDWGASSTYIDLDRGKDEWLDKYLPVDYEEIKPIKTVAVESWVASLWNAPEGDNEEIGKVTKAQRLPITEVSENGKFLKVEAWIPSEDVKEVT